jgi:hypothetical protein
MHKTIHQLQKMPLSLKKQVQKTGVIPSALLRPNTRLVPTHQVDHDLSPEPVFKPHIAAILRKDLQEKPLGIPIEEAMRELGLDD